MFKRGLRKLLGSLGIKMSSDQWYDLSPELVILDPDGWDRENFTRSWYHEKITLDEFEDRVIQSTLEFSTVDLMKFLK